MDIFNPLNILMIWVFMKFVLIVDGLASVTTAGSDLCRIQIQVSELLITNTDVSMRGVLMDTSEVIVSLDTRYAVTCVTDERVRLRNHLALEWSNSSSSLNDLTTRLISNTTMTTTSKTANKPEILSYLRGYLTLKSSEFTSNTVLSLFCRFLTIDPSLYCEKTVTLKVYSVQDLKSRTMRTCSIVVFVIGLGSIVLKLYLNDLVEQKNKKRAVRHVLPELKWIKSLGGDNHQTYSNTVVADDNSNNSGSSSHPISQVKPPQIKIEISEKYQTIKISKDDFDFSTLYPTDSAATAPAATAMTTSQTMIITECNPDISNNSTVKYTERLI